MATTTARKPKKLQSHGAATNAASTRTATTTTTNAIFPARARSEAFADAAAFARVLAIGARHHPALSLHPRDRTAIRPARMPAAPAARKKAGSSGAVRPIESTSTPERSSSSSA